MLHDTPFIADLHSDSLLWRRNLADESEVGHMDVRRLERGNVALQVFSTTTKSPKGQNYDSNTADSDLMGIEHVALVPITMARRPWRSTPASSGS